MPITHHVRMVVAISFWNAKDLTYDQWRAETQRTMYTTIWKGRMNTLIVQEQPTQAPVRDGMYDYAWSSDGAAKLCSFAEC